MINNKIKIFFYRISLLLLLVTFFSILTFAEIDLEIEVKESFGPGEIINFNYTIKSSDSIHMQYFPSFVCGDFESAPYLLDKDINSGFTYGGYYEGVSTENFDGKLNCEALVEIISPDYFIKTKNFSIITDPSFSFSLKTCKDQSCFEKSKIFILNRDIYLDYSSSVENPGITAILTYPDGNQEDINLPTSIKASQIGTYELELTASKEGHKTITKKEQFGVIEKWAEIRTGFAEESIGKDISKNYTLLMVGFIIFLGIIVIIVLLKKRKNS